MEDDHGTTHDDSNGGSTTTSHEDEEEEYDEEYGGRTSSYHSPLLLVSSPTTITPPRGKGIRPLPFMKPTTSTVSTLSPMSSSTVTSTTSQSSSSSRSSSSSWTKVPIRLHSSRSQHLHRHTTTAASSINNNALHLSMSSLMKLTTVACLVVGQYVSFWNNKNNSCWRNRAGIFFFTTTTTTSTSTTTATTTTATTMTTTLVVEKVRNPTMSVSRKASQQQQQDEEQEQGQQQPKLLLNVPYYVYEKLIWDNATFGEELVKDIVSSNDRNPKHNIDYFFMMGSTMYEHPMRVYNPDDAELYVLPLLLNTYDTRSHYKDSKGNVAYSLCYNNMCNYQLMKYAGNVIRNSIYYQQYPEKHVVVASHWSRIPKTLLRSHTTHTTSSNIQHKKKTNKKLVIKQNFNQDTKLPSNLLQVLNNCNVINFENRIHPNSNYYKYLYHDNDDNDDDDDDGNNNKRSNNKSNSNGNRTSKPIVGTQFPQIYVGETCNATAVATTTEAGTGGAGGPNEDDDYYDVILVATMRPDDRNFQDRTNICNWLNNTSSTTTTTTTAAATSDTSTTFLNSSLKVFCGSTTTYQEYCPIISKAKYGFHVRGDSFGSNRLFDLLLNGVIPIFTHHEQYDISPPFINWTKLSYVIEMGNGDSSNGDGIMITKRRSELFLRQLQHILQDKDGLYEEKKQLILDNRHLFDWKYNPIYPFDMYMYYFHTNLIAQQQQLDDNNKHDDSNKHDDTGIATKTTTDNNNATTSIAGTKTTTTTTPTKLRNKSNSAVSFTSAATTTTSSVLIDPSYLKNHRLRLHLN